MHRRNRATARRARRDDTATAVDRLATGRRRTVLGALLSACLCSCAAPHLPTGFAAAAAEAPENLGARLVLDGDRIVGATASVGPGGLPAAVRTAVEAVAPAGELEFAGREWGPAGEGYRVEKRYRDGAVESFRSALIADDGTVLERTHSVDVAAVPRPVATAVKNLARTVSRFEIVSGPKTEIGWRASYTDGAGWRWIVDTDLGGTPLVARRMIPATLLVGRGAPR